MEPYAGEWYDEVYHGAKMSAGGDNPPGPDVHADRDRAFFRALGLGPGRRTLECGCGGGGGLYLMTAEFRCDRLAAFDFSRVAAEYCQRWFPQVDVRVASARRLPWPDRSFDVIVAKDFTEHLALVEYMGWLGECRRLLGPGGVIGALPGLTLREEHINSLLPLAVAQHLSQFGFRVEVLTTIYVLASRVGTEASTVGLEIEEIERNT